MRRIVIAALALAITTAACGTSSAAAPMWTFAPSLAAAPASDPPAASQTATATTQPEALSATTGDASTTSVGTGTNGASGGVAGALAPSDAAVRIENFDFTPATVTIQAGGKVTWTNADGDRHSVLFDGSESPRLEQNGAFTKAFSTAGRFAYVCGIHSSMSGVVVVVDGGSPAATTGNPGSTTGTTTTPSGTASPDATAAPTASPDDPDDDHSGHGGGENDEDNEDHSGPGGGGSGHG